ncbi:hypothetical protein J6590_081656 [Homalodisca vitripennis]|nr:hypothetical protein J6590_081656 [Homalodisca vitripennis]
MASGGNSLRNRWKTIGFCFMTMPLYIGLSLLIDTNLNQAISARLTSGAGEHFFKIGAHISGDINRRKYEPILEYKFPETAALSNKGWIGRKGVKGGSQKQNSAVQISGAVYVENNPGTPYKKYEVKSVTVTTPNIKLTADGIIAIDANLVTINLKTSYDKDTLVLNSKIQKLGERKYITEVDLLSLQYPELAGSVSWEFEGTPHKIENKLVVVHGSDLKSEVSRISITQLLTYNYESVKKFEFYTENTVSYPLFDFFTLLKGSVAPKSMMYDVDINYNNNQVRSKLDAKVGLKVPTDYSINFEDILNHPRLSK